MSSKEMNICFSVADLEIGGAQLFVVRLARAMSEHDGIRVFIYDHWPERRNAAVAEVAGPKVTLLSYCGKKWLRNLLWKMNGVTVRLARRSLREHVNRFRFSLLLRKHHITHLNSHSSYSDFVIASIRLPRRCCFIPSLHGEYEMILSEPGKPDRTALLEQVISRAQAVIYTADKNLMALDRLATVPARVKIPVGFDATVFRILKLNRGDLGLAGDDFLAGMVSRGIPEKGWETAISAVQRFNREAPRPVKLLLVGNGSYLSDLVKRANDPNIMLRQFERNFQDYFSCYQLFDIFLFPSRFVAESVPNAVIESLWWEVPVLAYDTGELAAMLDVATTYPAGRVVKYTGDDDRSDERYSNAFRELVNDRGLLARMKANCRAAFGKFDLGDIASRYIEVFEKFAV